MSTRYERALSAAKELVASAKIYRLTSARMNQRYCDFLKCDDMTKLTRIDSAYIRGYYDALSESLMMTMEFRYYRHGIRVHTVNHNSKAKGLFKSMMTSQELCEDPDVICAYFWSDPDEDKPFTRLNYCNRKIDADGKPSNFVVVPDGEFKVVKI